MVDGKDGLGLLIMGFVFLIVGVVLFGVIADAIYGITTESQTVTNESMTLSSGAGATVQDDLVSAPTEIYNGTSSDDIDVQSAGFGACNVTIATGAIKCNSSVGAGPLLVTYSYNLDDFINDTASRSLILLINLFFALAILAGAIWVGISGFRKMGMI